jgi:hypothetical protein
LYEVEDPKTVFDMETWQKEGDILYFNISKKTQLIWEYLFRKPMDLDEITNDLIQSFKEENEKLFKERKSEIKEHFVEINEKEGTSQYQLARGKLLLRTPTGYLESFNIFLKSASFGNVDVFYFLKKKGKIIFI